MKCNICPFYCNLEENSIGLCNVIYSRGRKIANLASKYAKVQITEVEETGFFHFYPGNKVAYIYQPGCNLKCLFCKKWSYHYYSPPIDGKEEYARIRQLINSKKISCVIFSCSVLFDIEKIRQYKQLGTHAGAITFGVFTSDYLKELIKNLDAILVQFLGFSNDSYRRVTIFSKGIDYAKRSVEIIYDAGKHLEVSYIIIPGVSDDVDQINEFATWLREIDKDVPLHFRRFYPAMYLANKAPTRTKLLKQAYNIAKRKGLKFVYIDDLFEDTARNTICPNDGTTIIERVGRDIAVYLKEDSTCPACGSKIPILGQFKSTLKKSKLKFL